MAAPQPMPDLPELPRPLLLITGILLICSVICTFFCYFTLIGPQPGLWRWWWAPHWLRTFNKSIIIYNRLSFDSDVLLSDIESEEAARTLPGSTVVITEEEKERLAEFEWLLRRARFEQENRIMEALKIRHECRERKRSQSAPGDLLATTRARSLSASSKAITPQVYQTDQSRSHGNGRGTMSTLDHSPAALTGKISGVHGQHARQTVLDMFGSTLEGVAREISRYALAEQSDQQKLLFPVTQCDRETAAEYMRTL